MMIINIETYQDALKKLAGPGTRQEGIDMLKKMREIKEAHLWRSEVIAPCCGNLGGFACQLNEEIGLLEKSGCAAFLKLRVVETNRGIFLRPVLYIPVCAYLKRTQVNFI